MTDEKRRFFKVQYRKIMEENKYVSGRKLKNSAAVNLKENGTEKRQN